MYKVVSIIPIYLTVNYLAFVSCTNFSVLLVIFKPSYYVRNYTGVLPILPALPPEGKPCNILEITFFERN